MLQSLTLGLSILATIVVGAQSNADEQIPQLEFRVADVEPSLGWSEKKAPQQEKPLFVSEQVVVTGADIAKVFFFESPEGDPVIGFELTDSGAERMAKATSANVGKRLAILLGGKVVSAPMISSEIRKDGVISGSFGPEDLTRFFEAIVLRRRSAE